MPIKIFSLAFISKLTEDQLDTIIEEEVTNKRKRAKLIRKIKSLENRRKLFY